MKNLIFLGIIIMLFSCEKTSENETESSKTIYSNSQFVGLTAEQVKNSPPGNLYNEGTNLGQKELIYECTGKGFEYKEKIYFKFSFKNDTCIEMTATSLGQNQINLMYDFSMNYHQLTSVSNASILLQITTGQTFNPQDIPELWNTISDNNLKSKVKAIDIVIQSSFGIVNFENNFFFDGNSDSFMFKQVLK